MSSKVNTRRLFIWAVVLIAISGPVLYVVIPDPPAPDNLPAAVEPPWSKPVTRDFSTLKKAHKAILTRKPWGDTQVTKQPAPSQKKEQWRLRGVVRAGDTYFALIEWKGKVQRYLEGDTLPGGEILQTIYHDRIEVRSEDDTRLIKLYYPQT